MCVHVFGVCLCVCGYVCDVYGYVCMCACTCVCVVDLNSGSVQVNGIKNTGDSGL